MNDFWNNKSLAEVTREFLLSSADNLIDLQPVSAEGITEQLCGNITIRNNAQGFVADYLDDAIDAVREYKPDSNYRLSQYSKTVNIMLNREAQELLAQCDTVQRYEGSYHIWNRADVEDLKEDLQELDLSHTFQRAADVRFESLENYTYRFLDYVLPDLEGRDIKLDNLLMELPLVSVSEQDARSFLKANFDEAMRLLDDFRNSGYKVDYSNAKGMVQAVFFQQQKEILKSNPYLEDLMVYDGISTVRADKDFIGELKESLEKQKNNVRLSKFEEMVKYNEKVIAFPKRGGQVVDLRPRPNRVEVLY